MRQTEVHPSRLFEAWMACGSPSSRGEPFGVSSSGTSTLFAVEGSRDEDRMKTSVVR